MKLNKKYRTVYIILPIIIIMLLYIGIPIQKKNVNYFIRGYARFHLVLAISVKNNEHNRNVSGDLIIPIPHNSIPYQYVSNVKTSPLSEKIIKDSAGNTSKLFHITLEPDGESEILMTFDALVNHVYFPLKSGDNNSTFITSKSPTIKSPHEDISKEIVSIAGKICEHEPDQFYRVVKLYDFLRTNLTFRNDPYSRSALEVLRDKNAQCADANKLFISLCRASGIPAKFIGGLYISKGRTYYPETHSWSRVYLNKTGWIPVDPTLGRFDDRSRYLCFGEQQRFYIELMEGSSEMTVFKQNDKELRKPDIYLNMNVYCDEEKMAIPLKETPIIERKIAGTSFKESYTPASYNCFRKAMGLKNQVNGTEAVKYLTKAIELSPDFLRAHRELIDCCFNMGLDEWICSKYDEMIRNKPNDCTLTYCKALCLIYKAYYSKAEHILLRCREKGWVSSYLFNSLGYIYLKTKQFNRAEEAFANALQYEDSYMQAYMNLILMYQNDENWDKMLYWSKRGLKEYPAEPFLLGQTGYGCIITGKPKEALVFLRESISRMPKAGWNHALLGWALKDLGEKKNARDELKKALILKTGIQNLKYYDDMLKELKE